MSDQWEKIRDNILKEVEPEPDKPEPKVTISEDTYSRVLMALDIACYRITDLEHILCQYKDAADELRFGIWPEGQKPFIIWGPGDERPLQVDPERVKGFFEAFSQKLLELGDFSSLREEQKRVKKLIYENDELLRLVAELRQENKKLGGLQHLGISLEDIEKGESEIKAGKFVDLEDLIENHDEDNELEEQNNGS